MGHPRPARDDSATRGEQTSPAGEDGGSSGRGSSRRGPSVWEWVVGGVSAVLVLGLIGYILYEAVAVPESPPRLEITVDSVVPAPNGYLAEFSIRNRGQSTAKGLLVQGELKSDTGSVETAEVTIDYVPAKSRRRAGLFFRNDPRAYELEISPKGFDRP